MAIAEMCKLNLVALEYERDKILNALQQTRALEIKQHEVLENTDNLQLDSSEITRKIGETEGALATLAAEISAYCREKKVESDALADGFDLSYTDFLNAVDLEGEVDGFIARITALAEQKRALQSEQTTLSRTLEAAKPYSSLTGNFAAFRDSAHAVIKLGTLPAAGLEALKNCEEPLFAFDVLNEYEGGALVLAAFHRSCDGGEILSAAGFSLCPFKEGTGEELNKNTTARLEEIKRDLAACAEEFYSLSPAVKTLKIYSDFLSFELEKASLAEKMRATQATFLLEGYVPADEKEVVSAAVEGVTKACWMQFSEPSEEEIPPTLYRNNAIISNFETITDTYSPPSSREFDPNTIMAFFYSLFLGFIMADVGYGILMILGGGLIYFKTRSRPTTMTRLGGVFAVGGVFAIIWGFLFNSVFGIALGYKPVIPDAQSAMWSLAGINVPAVLVISLELGVFQLCAGYICRAVQCLRRGQILDAICDGVFWALFSVGVGLAIVGFVEEANVSELSLVGGIMAGVSLALAVLTAGRHEKLLGKFTKGFGAAYGVINYASDILSYARLYGLMLSGAVIAQIVSGFAVTGMNGSVGFLVSGNPLLVILGVVILLIGHAFNFAISLLGAYIHDARLQYVEFYGRFFEGEGELFAPLGSKHKYVRLIK